MRGPQVGQVGSGAPFAWAAPPVTGAAGRAALVSRSRKAPSSWIVLISGAGNTLVEFLSTPISTIVLALGGDDLGALLALGLGPRTARVDPSQPELHAPLVLLDDAHRARQPDDQQPEDH